MQKGLIIVTKDNRNTGTHLSYCGHCFTCFGGRVVTDQREEEKYVYNMKKSDVAIFYSCILVARASSNDTYYLDVRLVKQASL